MNPVRWHFEIDRGGSFVYVSLLVTMEDGTSREVAEWMTPEEHAELGTDPAVAALICAQALVEKWWAQGAPTSA